jgi:hypothetical protein
MIFPEILNGDWKEWSSRFKFERFFSVEIKKIEKRLEIASFLLITK